MCYRVFQCGVMYCNVICDCALCVLMQHDLCRAVTIMHKSSTIGYGIQHSNVQCSVNNVVHVGMADVLLGYRLLELPWQDYLLLFSLLLLLLLLSIIIISFLP